MIGCVESRSVPAPPSVLFNMLTDVQWEETEHISINLPLLHQHSLFRAQQHVDKLKVSSLLKSKRSKCLHCSLFAHVNIWGASQIHDAAWGLGAEGLLRLVSSQPVKLIWTSDHQISFCQWSPVILWKPEWNTNWINSRPKLHTSGDSSINKAFLNNFPHFGIY